MKPTLKLLLFISLLALYSCIENTFMDDVPLDSFGNPTGLKYMDIKNAREGKAISSGVPSINTGGLTPMYEIVAGRKDDGTLLDESYMQYVSIAQFDTIVMRLDNSYNNKVDENGDTLRSVSALNTSNNGVISIADGNSFTVGDYYFSVKATTQHEGKVFSTTFDDVFHLNIEPLLASYLIYSPKNQNLVYGNTESKTSVPLLPSANADVTFELAANKEELVINPSTGVVSLSPDYVYSGYDTLFPVINVVNNISGELVSFSNSLIAIVTNQAEQMPVDTINFFYPTLKTSGSKPSGGDGFSVQVDIPGNGDDIWGEVDNSNGRYLETPSQRPEKNTAQTVLETQTFNSAGVTKPTQSWCVTSTQDLSAFQYGYDLSFNYYYNASFLRYMEDGRAPNDLEVYISTDYTGGDIQDGNGNWINGTWKKLNEQIACQIGAGVSSNGKPAGAPWGEPFIGTPYPGDNTGPDPEGRKVAGRNVYGKWVKCTYNISEYKTCKTFTVAFKVASYFEGELLNNSTIPGRGGVFFLSDFYYRAAEIAD
ncbi:hypothetical protein SAMN05444274_106206 [Mariniphaga anaerophila]|uniref:DUF1735 domain-containing protein n=1 Tax=Mariniphaga anaerophila TaxID=1484053 RepID=A0A1M5CP62_9BACT|nr:hypothetical protein [Mariniphaga anaerophila]SHF56508.1 hypothetical protein SAMN05444274_106206 [Mariniphaga anaerophila]